MKNLKARRKEVGYSQKDMAEALYVSQQCYSDYENGRTNPDMDTLMSIADILHVSIDYLLGREDELGNIIFDGEELTESERQLLNGFRRLSPNMQKYIIANVEILLKQAENQ